MVQWKLHKCNNNCYLLTIFMDVKIYQQTLKSSILNWKINLNYHNGLLSLTKKEHL